MKRWILLVLILIVAAEGAACQPTPEEGIIKNKKNATFVDQLESQNKNTEINDNEPNISEPIDKFEGYEKQWYEDIKAKGKNINVKFEANIVVPNADKIPIYEVILNKISQEQVDSFLSAFGDTKYSLGFELYTKEYYEERILEMKEYLSVELPNKDCNEKTRNRLKEEYEAGIESCTKKMREAPETTVGAINPIFTNEYVIKYAEQNESLNDEEELISDISIRETYEDNNTEAIEIKWIYNDEEMRLSTQRSDFLSYNSFSFSVIDNNPVSIEDMINVPTLIESEADIDGLMSFEEAKTLAEDTICRRLGIEYLTVAHSFTDGKSYMFFFTRNFKGINCTYCSNDIGYLNAYDEPWFYENVYVEIDEVGVRTISTQSSLSSIGEIISEDVALLSFDEIKEIAKEQFLVGNIVLSGYYASEDIYMNLSKMDLGIDEIVFGYQRIKIGDGSGRYCLAPVWDFFGSCVIEAEYNDGTEYIRDSKDLDYLGIYRHSYLTINAIDGSIIDRSLGY